MGSNNDNIIEIGNRHVGIWMDSNSKVFVESKVSGSALQTRMGGFSTGTWHKVEVTQSLIVDKVSNINIQYWIYYLNITLILLKYYANINQILL